MSEENKQQNTEAMQYDTVLPAVFSPDEMIAFGNFIRDNYYVAGTPEMQPYNKEKYIKGNVEDIYVIWCCENGR